MIKNFRCKETQRIFNREYPTKFSLSIIKNAMRKLWILDAAVSIDDLRIPPSNHLEKLKGKRKDERSIRINDKWRVCFRWSNGDAYDVIIENYH